MIELNNVTLTYDKQTILSGQNLTIAQGSRIALMGPSGCGKTSLLRLIAGLIKPDAGTISIRTDRISYLFQEPRLFPWLTAKKNVHTVLSGKKDGKIAAAKWLEAVGLSDAADKYPAELSGGMQQRVSLARALAYNGEIILLDEPLKGLDTDTKAEMVRLIQTHTAGKTLLLATHDPEEARTLTDILYIYGDKSFLAK